MREEFILGIKFIVLIMVTHNSTLLGTLPPILKNGSLFIRALQAPAWEVQRTAGAVVGAIGTSRQVFSAGTRSCFAFSRQVRSVQNISSTFFKVKLLRGLCFSLRSTRSCNWSVSGENGWGTSGEIRRQHHVKPPAQGNR